MGIIHEWRRATKRILSNGVKDLDLTSRMYSLKLRNWQYLDPSGPIHSKRP